VSAIVSDTTALIVLRGQGRLDLLCACFEQVHLPEAVYREWLAGDSEVGGLVERSACLRVTPVTDLGLCRELGLLLDGGEAKALTLARERGLPMLVDEKKGRSVARMMGVPVVGLVGLLLLAVERQALASGEAEHFLDAAITQGFRLSDRLRESFRRALETQGK
jgi:predicted nucleic acid-binding protein